MAFANLTEAWETYPWKNVPADKTPYIRTMIVKSGTTIYKGSPVVNEHSGAALTGYAVYADDASASDAFVGIALETVTGDGTKTIRCLTAGWFPFVKGTPAITDLDVKFYVDAATDPKTVDNAGNLVIGTCVEIDATNGIVYLDITKR